MRMTKQEFLASSGIRTETLEVWLEQRWLVPRQEAGGSEGFSDIDLARARLITELKEDIGANDEGVDVILHLIDQLHEMRRMLARMREDYRGGGPP